MRKLPLALLLSFFLITGCSNNARVAEPTLKFAEMNVERHPNLSTPGGGEKLVSVRVSNTTFQGGGKTKNTYTLFESDDCGKTWPRKKSHKVNNTDRLGIRRIADLMETDGAYHAVCMTRGIRPSLLSFSKTKKRGTHKFVDDSWKDGHGIFAAALGKTVVYGQPQKGKLRLLVSQDEGKKWDAKVLGLEYEGKTLTLKSGGRTSGMVCQAAVDSEGSTHIFALAKTDKDFQPVHAVLEGDDLKVTAPFLGDKVIGIRLFRSDKGLTSFVVRETSTGLTPVYVEVRHLQNDAWTKPTIVALSSKPDGWDLSPANSFSIDVAGSVMGIAYVSPVEKRLVLQVTYSLDGGESWTPSEVLGEYNKHHRCMASPTGLLVTGSNSNSTKAYKEVGKSVVFRAEI